LHGTDFIHPDYHPVFGDFLETIMAGGTFQTQATDIRKDGTAFPVEVNGSLLTYKGRPHILAVVRDITERVRAYELLEQRVEERTRELSTLLKVSHHVVSSLELEPLLAIIFDQLATVIDYADSSIFALEGEDLRIIGNRGPLPSEEIHVRFPVSPMGPSEPIVTHGRTVIIDDVQGDSREAREFREAVGVLAGSVGIRSWMGVPMRVGERVIGALSVAYTEPGYYTQHHAALVLAIAQQAALAVENARLYEEAQDVAVLEERQRLARELHDSVSQALYGIVLGSQTARALLPRQPESVAEPLEYVLGQAEAALADMRALIFELRPEVLEQEGLVSALEKRVAVMCARHNLSVRTELADEPDVPFAVKEAVYRIAQEALHNVIKHAGAHRVEVNLDWDGRTLALVISDDGSGFDPGGSFPGHFGLKTMRERVARLAGTFSIDSTVGQGTRISVTIPIG
jgi:signal transduction histidine kinase